MGRWIRRLTVLLVIVVLAGGYYVWHRIQTAPVKASAIMPAVSRPAAQKAVVTSTDMPDKNWKASPADDDQTQLTFTPAACSAVGEKPATKSPLATSSFERGGSFAAAVVETIYHPAGHSPAAEVAQLRSLVSKCSTYRYREGDAKAFVVSVVPLVVKKQATDTLAIQSSVAGFTTVSDTIVWVAAGDVVVRFDSITAGDGMTQSDLEKLVRKSLVRLKK